MDLFARFIGLMVVFVIYIAVDVEGVAYGGACTADSECTTDTNADKCDIDVTDKCICNDDSFRQATSSTCIAKLAVDADCVSSDAGTCADTNSECKDDSSGTSNDKCLCKTTHYDASGTCTLKIVLNAACTTSPNGQCADALAACDGTALVCTCSAGNFEKNDGTCAAQVAALEGACATAETATDQCAIADSECRTDQCLCKATHYKNGAACTARIAQEEDCTGDQCVEHATCDTTCKCDAGYTASPATNPTMCSGVAKFASLSYMYVVPILVSTMSLLR